MATVGAERLPTHHAGRTVPHGLPPVDERSPTTVSELLRPISHRIRRLHLSPWAPVETPALATLWQHALELVQALTESQDDRPAVVATESVNELLAAIERSLQALESHQALCEYLLAAAERLHPIVEEIAYGTETSSRKLFHVAREFTTTLTESPQPPCLVPVAGFSPVDVLEKAGWTRAEWWAQTLVSTRLTAAVWPALALPPSLRGWFMSAVLMQDIGCWALSKRGPRSERLPVRRRAEPNHPATGAAMLTGLSDASAMLSLLVGAHHERWDGTGFPQRLSGSRLAREQQSFALLVRITELLLDPLTAELAIEHAEPLETAAGLRLWREVRRGAFAEPLVVPILDAVRTGLTEEVQSLFPTRVRRLLDVAHPVPAPLGDATPPARIDEPPAMDAGVKQPAFLRRARSRGGSLVRSVSSDRHW